MNLGKEFNNLEEISDRNEPLAKIEASTKFLPEQHYYTHSRL